MCGREGRRRERGRQGEREAGREVGRERGIFSPRHYVPHFHRMGVSTVVRLNEPEYDRDEFVRHGIAHHNLHFPDCTFPPPHIVQRFFDIADNALGWWQYTARRAWDALGRSSRST